MITVKEVLNNLNTKLNQTDDRDEMERLYTTINTIVSTLDAKTLMECEEDD